MQLIVLGGSHASKEQCRADTYIHDTCVPCVPTLHVVPLLTVDFWEGNSVGKNEIW